MVARLRLGMAQSGARVIVTDISTETAEDTARQIRSAGGNAAGYQLDVTDAGACAALAARIERDIGAAAVVVNNAGIIIRETIDSPTGARELETCFGCQCERHLQRRTRLAARLDGRVAAISSMSPLSLRSLELGTRSATRPRKGR